MSELGGTTQEQERVVIDTADQNGNSVASLYPFSDLESLLKVLPSLLFGTSECKGTLRWVYLPIGADRSNPTLGYIGYIYKPEAQ